ncbi:MAG: HipA domain-containing protein [Acidobacteria bacterium]|nr:HipA domain-containing protein [Acidobacteriota bacterium]
MTEQQVVSTRMRHGKGKSALRPRQSEKKEIKYWSDYQLDWDSLIPLLRNYKLEKVDFLSITGDAPKDFVTDSEYRPGHRSRRQRQESYIAKVGSKFYPNESITEHLITRIGQIYGLKIADSKLRIVAGQVRFMSKYFLNRSSEQLTHGAEVFELCLGKENYKEIADKKIESEYFTFQMTVEAIKDAFPGFEDEIVAGFVEMLTFDALIGHNDRHPYNWGVIVPLYKKQPPHFSPVFDTARALFWNVPERRIRQMITDQMQLVKYVTNCAPPIGWDHETKIDFFRLVGLIWGRFEQYRKNIEKFLGQEPLKQTSEMVVEEFGLLMSAERRELIKRCLHLRQHFLNEAVVEFGRREEL